MKKNWLYEAFNSALSCPINIHERVEEAKAIVPDSKERPEEVVKYLINKKCKAASAVGTSRRATWWTRRNMTKASAVIL